MQRVENYSAGTTSFGPHQYQMQKVIKAQTGVVTPSYVDGPAHGVNVTNGGAFFGGCLMRNGKVLLSPSSNNSIFIFDPTTDTLIQGPVHGETNPAFNGAISVSETLVVLPPDFGSYIGLYNPITNAYTRGPAKLNSADRFAGGTVLPDGKVLLAPTAAPNALIYDPITNAAAQGPAMTNRGGAQLMADGRVLLPDSTDVGGPLLVYDHETGSVTPTINSYVETRDLVVIADGRIAAVATDLARVFLFDFRYSTADPIRISTDTWPSNVTNKFRSGALAANGDVVFAPFQRQSIGYYRPPSPGFPLGQIFDGPAMPSDGILERFTGCVPMPDGRFLMIPRKHPRVGIYTHLSGGQPLPPEVLMSPFHSNSF
ncbi:hypothetical protein [Sphingobium sp. WCS2017Hpa-17]|uniref:hypothetical protein n=1 Tax=Sphingobium sp. WCS2017Hpa-17 TaxID=3073638 RepID=UPI00288A98B4|nr:hypothetical protein [Sphingobium sp. WCS2017Hpa-17]